MKVPKVTVMHHENILALVLRTMKAAQRRGEFLKGKEAKAELLGEVRALTNLAGLLANYKIEE